MDDGKILTAELVVYDKHSRCLLTEGEYELVLAEAGGGSERASPKKNNSSWETISVDKSDKVRRRNLLAASPNHLLSFRRSLTSSTSSAAARRLSFASPGAASRSPPWWSDLGPSCLETTPRIWPRCAPRSAPG
jgi:hypothetical protein